MTASALALAARREAVTARKSQAEAMRSSPSDGVRVSLTCNHGDGREPRMGHRVVDRNPCCKTYCVRGPAGARQPSLPLP